MQKKSGKSDKLILLIGVFKFVKALLLLALAVGALKLIGKDLGEELKRLVEQLNVDADNRFFRMTLRKVAGIDEGKLALISAGTFFYSALFFAEGIGLLLRKRWGEILAVIITSTFLPLEIYELVKESSVFKIILLVLNVVIVGYLIWRLVTEKKRRKAK